jgi:adenosine deaminase
MFETSLEDEYAVAFGMGLSTPELIRIAEAGFEHSFLPEDEKRGYLQALRTAVSKN